MSVYLFEYQFDGAEWALEVEAENPMAAHERVAAMGCATYQGELAEKIPERTPGRIRLVGGA